MKTILQKNCRRIAFAGILFTSLVSAFHARAELAAINRVPFISTVSLERTVTSGTAPKYKFYVTDYENKDYMKNDFSETFVVRAYLDGSTLPFHTGTYAAGEHEVTLPTMSTPADEKRIGIQATDSAGRKSDMLVQRFRVVDSSYFTVSGTQIFEPTAADLFSIYGIYNDGSNAASTTAGLNALLQASGSNGWRKVVLPGGTYLIQSGLTVGDAIRMPSRVTLDLNGSTLKAYTPAYTTTPPAGVDANYEPINNSVTVEMANVYDAHVINGTIEGNMGTAPFTGTNAINGTGNFSGTAVHGKWNRGVRFAQGSEYCSFKNLTIKKFTGYGAVTTVDFIGRPPSNVGSYNTELRIGKVFELGEYDEATGAPVASTDRVRSVSPAFYDISPFMTSFGFIQVGRFSGNGTTPIDTWNYRASFYDQNENYIASEVGYMFRRMYPPAGTKYARFTFFDTRTTTDEGRYISIFNMLYPYNCDFTDIDFEDIRCVGMVPAGFNNLKVTGCTWTNCGWAEGRSAFDAEDGWDWGQDLVFTNNTFGTNPGAEFNGICGHNFLIENNTMEILSGARLGSAVIRNNTLKDSTFYFGPRDRSAYPRIYNNTIQGLTTLSSSYEESEVDREYLIRNNLCQGGMYVTGTTKALQRMYYAWSCTFAGGNVQGRVEDSTLTNVNTISTSGAVIGRWCELDGCIITSSTIKTGGFGNQSVIKNSSISSSVVNTQGSTLLMISNTIANTSFATPGNVGGGLGDKLHFEGNTISTSGTVLVKAIKGFGSVGLYNNTINVTNPTCQVLWLKADSGTNVGTFNMDATVCGNTFTGSSTASAVYVAGSGTNTTFRLGLKDNVYNTIGVTTGSTSVVSTVYPPAVSLTAPTTGSAGTAPVAITFDATASDTDGTISKVEFYNEDKFLGDDTSAPYSLPLSGFKAGSYSFTARAIDNGSTMNVSPPTAVTVSP